MPRSSLLLCLVAVLGAAISAGQFLRLRDARNQLEVQVSSLETRATKLESALAVATDQNGTLKANLAGAGTDLAAAREKISAGEIRAAVLEHDLAQAKSVLAVYEETTHALTDEVASLKADLADTRATFASPEAVTAYKNTISELERQLANSRNGAAAPAAVGASTAVFSSRPGRATIMTVGPQSAFVVLNFGSARGAQLGQRLNVNQGTDIVATVLISDVRTNFSVAQVQPETLRGVLQKGDLALLIR